MSTVLVVGGAGMFGSRLVEGLLATTPFNVVIGGRDLARSTAVADALQKRFGAGRVTALMLDARTVQSQTVKQTGASVLVDAAGPYQSSSFALAIAAIEAGLDYIDLADARGFVAAFPNALGAAARAAGVLAVTGMSSTPALSHAALDVLTAGWQRIDRVEVGISPGNRAPRARSVVAAILSWVGKPVRVFEDGAWRQHYGWSRHVKRAIPGLGGRWLALAETADLDCLVTRYEPRDAALFRAGLELPFLHRSLGLLAWLPRLGLMRSLLPLAGLLHRVATWFESFGTDRGGMMVEAWGHDASGRAAIARWVLTAEAGDGPMVPTLPALALLRVIEKNRPSLASGARNAAGVLPLATIAAEFKNFAITTQSEVFHPTSPLESALGDRFDILPEAVKRAHRSGPVTRLEGIASVKGADRFLAALAGRMFRFPREGTSIPVTVTMRLDSEGCETWIRDFGGRRFSSRLKPKGPGLITEQFGPFVFDLAIGATTEALTLRIVGWRLWRLPLPAWLAPRSEARETTNKEGVFVFDVPIALPLVGQVVRYTGSLKHKI